MNFLKKHPFCAAWLCLIFSALAACLRTLSYLRFYEAPESNYFTIGAILPVLSVAFAFLALGAGVLLSFSIPKSANVENLPHRWASVFPIFCILLGGAVLNQSKPTTLLSYAVAFALLATAYYFFVLFLPSHMNSAKVLCGIFPVLFLILLCALYYFDNHLESNAPLKTSLIAGLLFALVQLMGELRILLGRTQPRMYLFLSSAVIAIGSLTAIPVPIAFLRGVFDRSATQNNLHYPASVMDHTIYLAGAIALLGIVAVTVIRFLGFVKMTASEREEV